MMLCLFFSLPDLGGMASWPLTDTLLFLSLAGIAGEGSFFDFFEGELVFYGRSKSLQFQIPGISLLEL